MKTSIICITAMILAGCTMSGPPNLQQQSSVIEMRRINFHNMEITIPNDFKGPLERPDQSVAYWNYNDNTIHRTPSDMLIELFFPNSICSSSLTGTLKTTMLEADAKSGWGKVDFFDKYGTDYVKAPLCHPMISDNGVGYGFCAEKDGKTVVVCIGEVKDNPDLAKQIFETFRWTQ